MPKPAKKPAKKSAAEADSAPTDGARPVLYPKKKAVVHDEENPLRVKKAMELLGWTEESAGVSFGSDYLLLDVRGRKVRCLNNVNNRPFYASNADRLKQDILNRGRWWFNGEPVIIGETGLILNGQHTLVALVLAEQERTGLDAAHWAEVWDGEVTIQKLVVYGVSEDDRVVNTMDTAKPRSFTDVLYRSPYFAALKPSDRRVAARMLDYAVRLVWDRTHAKADPWAPLRTFGEAIDLITRHPRLVECVTHIHGEGVEKITGEGKPDVSPGAAAGLMYLMAASGSDGDAYRDDRREDALDMTLWDKAQDFWTVLMSGGKEFAPLLQAFSAAKDSGTGEGGTLREKVGILIKAWGYWVVGKPFAYEQLRLDYKRNNEGFLELIEFPVVGGIDFGRQEEVVAPDDDGADPEGDDLEAAKDEATAETHAAAAKKVKPKVIAGKPPSDPAALLKWHVNRLKGENDQRVLFFDVPGSQPPVYVLWESDAVIYSRVTSQNCGQQPKTGLHVMKVAEQQLLGAVEKLFHVKGVLSARVTGVGSPDDPYKVEHLDVKPRPSLSEPVDPVPANGAGTHPAPEANGDAPPPAAKPRVKPGTGPKLRGGIGG